MAIVVRKKVKPSVVKTAEATVTKQTTKTHKGGEKEVLDEQVGNERVGTEVFNEPLAEVECNVGLTRNLGNFESIKFGVTLRVPCNNTPEDVDQAFTFAKEWVDGRVNEINDEVDQLVDD